MIPNGEVQCFYNYVKNNCRNVRNCKSTTTQNYFVAPFSYVIKSSPGGDTNMGQRQHKKRVRRKLILISQKLLSRRTPYRMLCPGRFSFRWNPDRKHQQPSPIRRCLISFFRHHDRSVNIPPQHRQQYSRPGIFLFFFPFVFLLRVSNIAR